MKGEWVECQNCFSSFFYEPVRPKNGVYNGLYCPFCGEKIPPSKTIRKSEESSLVLEQTLIEEIEQIGFVDFDE